MQGIGYTGDRKVLKPTRRHQINSEVRNLRNSRKPLPPLNWRNGRSR
jgi:hypothetical protein